MKYDEDLEQDWEPVVLKKPKVIKPKIEEETPFNRLLINGRQSAKMTQHQLAQSLNIKLNDLEMYEQGLYLRKGLFQE